MSRAIERGLSLYAFDVMTPGMIIDYIITVDNEYLDDKREEEDTVRTATQADFDAF